MEPWAILGHFDSPPLVTLACPLGRFRIHHTLEVTTWRMMNGRHKRTVTGFCTIRCLRRRNWGTAVVVLCCFPNESPLFLCLSRTRSLGDSRFMFHPVACELQLRDSRLHFPVRSVKARKSDLVPRDFVSTPFASQPQSPVSLER